jgi:hypothetical protein
MADSIDEYTDQDDSGSHEPVDFEAYSEQSSSPPPARHHSASLHPVESLPCQVEDGHTAGRPTEPPACKDSAAAQKKRSHRLSSPLSLLVSSDSSIFMRRKSLDREYTSDDIGRLIVENAHNEKQAAEEPAKPRVNLSLAEIAKDKRKQDRVHRGKYVVWSWSWSWS